MKTAAVGHDAGGPAAVNFALKHPERTAAVTLMNAFYGVAPGLRVPELIALFSNKELKALHLHFLASPQQFAWLLDFQRNQLQAGLTETQKIRYFEFLGPIIDNNFRQQPGAGPAFAQMTSQLTDEIAANTARLVEFRRSDVPLLLVWGKADPYLHLSVANTCAPRPGMPLFMPLKQGSGRKSTLPRRSLASCLRTSETMGYVTRAVPARKESVSTCVLPPAASQSITGGRKIRPATRSVLVFKQKVFLIYAETCPIRGESTSPSYIGCLG